MGIILGAIVAAAATVTKALAVAGLAIQGLRMLGNIMVSLGKALGLIKPETKVENLGDKAIQSGYMPEDFDSYADYVKAVEDYDLDPEKSRLTTEEEKTVKGLELTVGLMIEKYQEFPIQDLCIAIGQNPEYFTAEKMGELAKLIQADGQNIPSILNYVNGTEKNTEKIQKAVDMLIGIEKSVDSSISDKEALKNVMRVRK